MYNMYTYISRDHFEKDLTLMHEVTNLFSRLELARFL